MENSTKKRRKRRGFTLIELVIVLAVMGIIALIAIPSLAGTKEHFKLKADDKSCQTIERATNVLITDETIKEGTSGSVEVVFKPDETISLESKLTVKGKAITPADKDNIEKAIKEVLAGIKKPQVKGADRYVITLKASTEGTGDEMKYLDTIEVKVKVADKTTITS